MATAAKYVEDLIGLTSTTGTKTNYRLQVCRPLRAPQHRPPQAQAQQHPHHPLFLTSQKDLSIMGAGLTGPMAELCPTTRLRTPRLLHRNHVLKYVVSAATQSLGLNIPPSAFVQTRYTMEDPKRLKQNAPCPVVATRRRSAAPETG